MWIYIVLAIILLLLFLLLSPLVATIDLREDSRVVLRYLFLRVQLYPKKPEKVQEKPKHDRNLKKKEQKKAAKKGPNPIKALFREQGAVQTVKLLAETAAQLPRLVLRALRGGRLRKLELTAGITGEDAAAAAINYGELCSVFWPFYGWLSTVLKIKKPRIDLHADYLGTEPDVSFYAKLFLTPLHLIAVALGGLAHLIQLQLLLRGGTPRKQKKTAARPPKSSGSRTPKHSS